MTEAFDGAKVAIVADGHVVALLRDERPGLPWAGFWDLPGGGREGRESPLACMRRETAEETGLIVPRGRVRHRGRHVRLG